MFTRDQYQLWDFGDGRRLESFGPWRLDRPCPTAEGMPQADPEAWQRIDARFERTDGENGQWSGGDAMPETWTIAHGALRLELKCSPFGHVGVFAEQAANWDWITGQVEASAEPPKVLNLFAYTGGSTLAAAAAGAEVVHVDAARNTVAWARRNAELSGLADAPIRWIAEDARKFVRRELDRGNTYDAVILDPPSYGHGPRGEVWQLSQHLAGLVAMCGRLTAGRRRFMLVTCHTPGVGPDDLARLLVADLGVSAGHVTAAAMSLDATTGRKLSSGVVARWELG
ncbi:MAG: class I SAM-dependent methyltransferase [Planctomycetia bacterium]|nr:class I SAM-dependent methyltransferase [Planctomycetia bacterium]